VVWVYFSFNVITDMYLLSIPLPMLWKSSLRPVKKVGLMILFGGGILVIACATLRCVLIVTVRQHHSIPSIYCLTNDQLIQDPVNGAQLAGSWAVRETFVAVIIGNIPMIYPFFRRTTRKFLDSSLFESINLSRNTKSQADGNGDFHGPSAGSSFGAGKKKFGGGRTLYPLSTIGGADREGSEERIIGRGEEVGKDGYTNGKEGMVGKTLSDGGNNKESTAITVVTETIVHERERMDGETGLQKSHWPIV
jgi:hypothetical protein